MVHPVGQRVFAVRNSDDEKVYLYGFGVYEGDFEPPVVPLTCDSWELFDKECIDRWGEVKEHPLNPRIRLDDGQVVWGFQCWWGPEERFGELSNGKQVEVVPVEALTES